jgi:hypothetical protein
MAKQKKVEAKDLLQQAQELAGRAIGKKKAPADSNAASLYQEKLAAAVGRGEPLVLAHCPLTDSLGRAYLKLGDTQYYKGDLVKLTGKELHFEKLIAQDYFMLAGDWGENAKTRALRDFWNEFVEPAALKVQHQRSVVERARAAAAGMAHQAQLAAGEAADQESNLANDEAKLADLLAQQQAREA